MNEVRDLKKYKFAKIVTNDMTKIIPRVQACIITLRPYRAYSQVAQILDELEIKLEVLKAQYNKYNKVVEEKGKR